MVGGSSIGIDSSICIFSLSSAVLDVSKVTSVSITSCDVQKALFCYTKNVLEIDYLHKSSGVTLPESVNLTAELPTL